MPEIQSPFCLTVTLPNHPKTPSLSLDRTSLDESELGGGDVQSINIGGEASVGLLGAVRTATSCQQVSYYEVGHSRNCGAGSLSGGSYRIRVLILTVSMS